MVRILTILPAEVTLLLESRPPMGSRTRHIPPRLNVVAPYNPFTELKGEVTSVRLKPFEVKQRGFRGLNYGVLKKHKPYVCGLSSTDQ